MRFSSEKNKVLINKHLRKKLTKDKKYDKTKSNLLRWLSIGILGWSVGSYTKFRSDIMKDYVDMGICLVMYLLVVVAIGGAIGLFLDWI